VPQQTPLSDEQRLRIAELADQGVSVRGIAARLKIAPSTVTRVGRRMGLSFDHSATAGATSARMTDAKARGARWTRPNGSWEKVMAITIWRHEARVRPGRRQKATEAKRAAC